MIFKMHSKGNKDIQKQKILIFYIEFDFILLTLFLSQIFPELNLFSNLDLFFISNKTFSLKIDTLNIGSNNNCEDLTISM